jgi:hypothetical protein
MTYLTHLEVAKVEEWPLLQEWSHPVPRIEDRLLKAIVYLYESEEAADSGEPGGSGFLVGEPCTIPEAVFLFAVTNAQSPKRAQSYAPLARGTSASSFVWRAIGTAIPSRTT